MLIRLAALLALASGSARAACPTTCPTCPITWTDPVLTANVTKIKKGHVEELRDCINLKRQAAGLPVVAWTDPVLAANVSKIKAVHVAEMRLKTGEIYVHAGQAAPAWTDPVLTVNVTRIKRVHIEELRNFVASAPINPPPPTCECGSWASGACGAGGCAPNQRQQTRTCTPTGCQAQTQCVADGSCCRSQGQLCEDNCCGGLVCNRVGRCDTMWCQQQGGDCSQDEGVCCDGLHCDVGRGYRCWPSACLRDGERWCGPSQPCCSGLVCVAGVCQGTPSCIGELQSCLLQPGNCCSGLSCLPGNNGMICIGSCSPIGGPCYAVGNGPPCCSNARCQGIWCVAR